jgi:hypothetical protein
MAGTAGNTSPSLNGFYYGLFIAPSTVTSLLPLDLLSPVWTFTDLYATNTAITTGGRLADGLGVSVAAWPPITNSYVLAGWSANIARMDWSAVSGQMADASFTNGIWSGPNWLFSSDGGFFGVSAVGYGQPPGPNSALPALNLFGSAVTGYGVPIMTGFDLFVVSSPEPSAWAYAILGVLSYLVLGRRVKT